MRTRGWPVGLAVVVWASVLLASACTRLSSPTRGSLRPCVLPDLSRMSESVQKQMREAHASLALKIEGPGTTPADLGNAYGEMGKLFMAAARLDAAETCFLNAEALAPDEIRWTYYLAHVYRNRGDPVKAAALFERTLQLQPTDLPALVYLGDEYLSQGRPEAAEPPLTKAVSLEPRQAVALFGLGRAALAKQDYARSVDHLEKALALDPQGSSIHYPLAMAYRGLGAREKAESHLRQRGDVRVGFLSDPLMRQLEELLESPQAYEIRGTDALDKGEWAAAAVYLRKGVQLAPGEPSVHLKLAEALRRSGRTEESLLHYEQVIRIDPHVVGAPFGYAMALVGLQRYQQARDRLTEAMKKFPDQPAFAHALARLLASSPDPHVRDGGRALALAHKLREQDPSTDLGETMAMALADLGRYVDAAALQRRMMKIANRAGRDDLAQGMAQNLRLYERREPCHTPWRDGEIP